MKSKNLPKNPRRGGIPANDKSNNTNDIVIKKKLPQLLSSFKVRK